tara:strand:+ start:354 stop:569 length:216 start_codon:yes stop_codon:yes gene_type:complete
MEDKTGGPAFPQQSFPERGMTLRQWYAGKAMESVFGMSAKSHTKDNRDQVCGLIAKLCFTMADAMISEGNK